MLRHRPFAFSVALLAACGGAPAPQAEAPAPPPEPPPTFTERHVLSGPDGVRVRIAEFGEDEAIFSFEGVRSPAAGIVFRGQIEPRGRDRITFKTRWDGGDYYPIHREPQGSEVRWRLFAPGLRSPVELTYDEARSSALDADGLFAEHQAQVADGTLARLQAFDRPAAQARQEESLARDLARTEEACGALPEWGVRWESIDDETLHEYSISGYCGNVLQAFRNVCRFAPGKELVASLGRVECVWAEEWSLERGESGLTFAVAAGATNLQQKAREALLAMPVGDELSLDQAIALAQTDVCISPDDAHVLVVHPHREGARMGISYGTRERLYHTPEHRDLSRGWFFDPRQLREGNNPHFRGRDLRLYQRVEVDPEEDRCRVLCGERETDWARLPPEEARALLQSTPTEASPFDREPYALARDRRGTYYYVDRGKSEANRRDFRVYRGLRGNMRQLEMRDIVSDSEGEIFSTSRGNLRLIVGNEGEAQWIHGRRPQELRRVPVEENYPLIMNELGVYLGARFELPCDDY